MPTVKLYASLRQVAKVSEVEIEGSSVNEILAAVSSTYDGKLDKYLKISTVLVNGRNVVHLKGRRTRLESDDTVSIFPPLGGG